ncbi:MAG: LPD38 domain-containing protein [bacterium]
MGTANGGILMPFKVSLKEDIKPSPSKGIRISLREDVEKPFSLVGAALDILPEPTRDWIVSKPIQEKIADIVAPLAQPETKKYIAKAVDVPLQFGREAAEMASWGAPRLIGKLTGQPTPELATMSEAGEIGGALGSLTGFMTPYKTVEKGVTKMLSKIAVKTPKGFAVKEIIKQAMALGSASALLEHGGDTLQENLKLRWDAAQHGAAVGGIFGVIGLVDIPGKPILSKILRFGAATAGIDLTKGQNPIEAILNDRSLAQKVFDYGLNAIFTWKPGTRDSIIKWEANRRASELSKELGLKKEQEAKFRKMLSDAVLKRQKVIASTLSDVEKAELPELAFVNGKWVQVPQKRPMVERDIAEQLGEALGAKAGMPSESLAKSRESLPERLSNAVGKPNQVELLKRGKIIAEDAQVKAIVDDAVTQKVNIAKAMAKKGKNDVANKLMSEARENAQRLKLADGPQTEKAINEALGKEVAEGVKKAEAKTKQPRGMKEAPSKIRTDLLPEGWKFDVGITRVKEGHTYEGQIDWRGKRVVFADKKYMADPKYANHEIAHVVIESLPNKDKLFDEYAEIKKAEWEAKGYSKEWIIQNHFHHEEIAIDGGEYLNGEKLPKSLEDLFAKYLTPTKTRMPEKDIFTKESIPNPKGSTTLSFMGFGEIEKQSRKFAESYKKDMEAQIAAEVKRIQREGSSQDVVESIKAYKAFKEEPSKKGAITLPEETAFQKFRRIMEDKNIRIKQLRNEMRKMGLDVPADLDIYYEISRLPRVKAEAVSRVQEQEQAFLQKLVDKKIDLEDFDSYLHALHSKERNTEMNKKRLAANGMEEEGLSGMTNADAVKIMEGLKDKYKGKMLDLQIMAQEHRKLVKETLDFEYENGLITEKEYNTYKDMYDWFVSLYRDMSDKGEFSGMTSSGRGIDVYGPEHKRAKGSHRRVISPLSNTFQNLKRAQIRALEAEAGRTIIKLTKEFPEYLKDIFEIKPSKMMPIGQVNIKGELQTVWGKRLKLKADEIGTKINGKNVIIKIKDPLIARALKNQNISSIPEVMKYLRIAKLPLKFMQSAVTKYRLDFLLRNFERDTGEALINLGVEKSLLKEKGKALRRDIIKNLPTSQKRLLLHLRGKRYDAGVDHFLKIGGRVGHLYGESMLKAEKSLYELERQIKGEGIEKIKNAGRYVDKLIDDVQSTVELGIRLSTFENLTKRGFPEKAALHAASDLTINFAKQGEASQLFGAFYMFFNPAVQGTSKILRTAASPHGRKLFITTMAGLATAGYMTRWLSNQMDSEQDNYISDFAKNTSVTFPVGDKQLTYWVLPYGYNIPWSIGSNLADITMGKKTEKEAVQSVMRTVTNAFSPVETDMVSLAPHQIKPFLDIAANQGWYGGPIHPEDRYDRTPNWAYTRYFSNAPEYSKLTAEYMNKLTNGAADVSPNDIDYALRQYLGGFYELGIGLPETVAKAVKEEELEFGKIPLIKQVIRESKPDQYVNKSLKEIMDIVGKRELNDTEFNRFIDALSTGVVHGLIDEKQMKTYIDEVVEAQKDVLIRDLTGLDIETEERELRRQFRKERRIILK